MAVMIPDGLGIEWKSTAERRLFNRLYRELPDNVYVLHSLGITRHPNKLIGETDFVLITPCGVYFLEVKGGGVACENGVWHFTDRNGHVSRKYESPWAQAASGLVQVRKEIENVDHLRGINCGYGVVFPDEAFLDSSPEIEQRVLLDQREWQLSLGVFLKRLDEFWEQKNCAAYGRVPLYPDTKQRHEIRKLLRPDIQSAYSLGSMFNNLQSELIALTDEQTVALRCIERNARCVISGGAGTGKTLLVRDRAMRLAQDGRRVLVLCYNRLLGEHLKANLQHANINAGSIHTFFNSEITNAGLTKQLETAKSQLPEDDYYSRAYPDIFMDAVTSQDGFEPFDVVVVDELQDLMKGSYLDAIDLAIKGGLESGHWHFFRDPNQNIFGSDGTLARLRSFGVAEYELTLNCRNSSKVAVNTSVLSGIDVSLVRAVPGGFEKLVSYDDTQHITQLLNAVIRDLTGNGVPVSDIIFLSPKTLRNSVLSEIKIEHGLRDLSNPSMAAPQKASIDFCTMQAFKGLERRVVIAVDLECIGISERQLLLYCGLSRANTGLVFCIPTTHKHIHEKLTAEFAVRFANANRS